MFPNKNFWIYLIISLIGHVIFAIALFILIALPLISAMGNSPSPWILTSGVLFLIGIIALVAFHTYFYSRKSISLIQKLIVSLLPLALGILISFSIPTINSYMMMKKSADEITTAINAITFTDSFKLLDTNTKLPNGSIIKHIIVIPFELKKETDINNIIFAYYVGLDKLTINANNHKELVECPMNNDIFSGIKDSHGDMHVIEDYSHGIILPEGKYEAIKYIDVYSSTKQEDICYEKIVNEIKAKKKIEIYEGDIHDDNSPLKMVAEPKLEEN